MLLLIPVTLVVLLVAVSLVHLEGGGDTTRILIMCTDPVLQAEASGLYKGPPPQRSDVMFVLEINEKERKVNCTQIPRDTMAYICPQSGLDKVNVSISIAGASRSRDVVGSLIGARINHYIVVSIPDFLQFIKIIGGVTITVGSAEGLAKEATKPASIGQKSQNPVLLKDWDALDYVMSRPGSDMDREKRQHEFLGAINSQCSRLGVSEMCRLAAWAWNLDGDISPVQMARYGRSLLKSRREVRTLGISSIYLNGTSYLLAATPDQGS
jgi:LCP family protein required for cell wall assembly